MSHPPMALTLGRSHLGTEQEKNLEFMYGNVYIR